MRVIINVLSSVSQPFSANTPKHLDTLYRPLAHINTTCGFVWALAMNFAKRQLRKEKSFIVRTYIRSLLIAHQCDPCD